MKNAFGGLLNSRRHYTHSVIHETLCDLLAIQKEIHSGIFTVMDGTVAGNGPGPRTMIPVEKDYMLASADSTAIDAIAAKMMGFDPQSLLFVRMAHEAGLGTGRLEDIQIKGGRHIRGKLAVHRWKQRGFTRGKIHLVRSPETDPETLFPHTPRVSFCVRVFLLSRLHLLAFEGPSTNGSVQEDKQMGKAV